MTVKRQGVMEYWSVGVLKKDIKPLAITPVLQYSNIAKPIQIEYGHDMLRCFDSQIRNLNNIRA
jgi:hypothetical protein